MAKEQERAELHKTIWRIADELRGSVDGWDFKNYVLGMLFYRFISENMTEHFNRWAAEAGDTTFDYALASDADAETQRDATVADRGFFILPSQLFCNVLRNAQEETLNEVLSATFRAIEHSAQGTASENDLVGLFADLDVNNRKLGASVEARNKTLLKVMRAIEGMQFGNLQDNTIDTFGDAYEYLMTMYASNAGKSGGEFFTPQEVSELLARLTTLGKQRVSRVYDPACGSGSLLLKFAKVLGKENVGGFYGQEINLTTYNLCRINMFLHNITFERFDIAHGDTLLHPAHWDDEPFECIVSNPPYSIRWEGKSNPELINDGRFSPAAVLAPESKADLAFTMHMLSWLSPAGTAAIVEFPGVLYRGGAEQKIREYMLKNNFVDAIIQLPDNLFFGTSIATCILVLKKNKVNDNRVLFIDASGEFVHEGNQNKLSEENIERILAAYTARKEEAHFCALVENAEIIKNGSNLSVSSYVSPADAREQVDILSLNTDIATIVSLQMRLRHEIDTLISEIA